LLEQDENKKLVVAREVKLGLADFFDFAGLNKQKYTLRVKTTLSPDLYDFKLTDLSVVLNETTTTLDLPFEAHYKQVRTAL